MDRRGFLQRATATTLALGASGIAARPRVARAAAIELGIPGFPGPSISAHSKVVIKALKLDEKHGWNLRWETRPTTDSYYNDFVTGAYQSIDFGGLNVFANLYNKGVPLKVVQATVHWPTPVVVKADSGIAGIADLAGKRLGVDRSSFAFAFVTASLKAAKLDPDKDLTVENVGFFQAPPRFLRGDFDAVVMLFEHAIDLLNKSPGQFKILFDSSETFAKAIGIQRAYQYQAIRDDWLAANPTGLADVLATYADLGLAFKEKPKELVALLAKPKEELGASLDPKIGEVEYITGTPEGYKTEWVSRPIAALGDDVDKELAAYHELGLIERLPDGKIFSAGS
jgi:NitT/TauT family transport system substrate-binding protein